MKSIIPQSDKKKEAIIGPNLESNNLMKEKATNNNLLVNGVTFIWKIIGNGPKIWQQLCLLVYM